MKLYPYQEAVLQAIESDPSHSQLISMPTGTGKTITFLNVAKCKDKRCLILVHREELLNQTLEKAKLCGFSNEEISVIKSSDKGEMKKLNIAMVPTLVRNLDKYSSDSVEMMIVDEAHHATANSYRKIFDFFKIFEEKKFIFGFTATPLRGDKTCLSDIFLSHSFKMTLSEATKQGFICPVYGLKVEIDKSLSDIDTVQGDYDVRQLDKVINCPEINKIIVERCSLIRKKPGIVFCTSVNHAIELAKMLRDKGKKAISVSHNTSKKNLERIYHMLKKGSVDFITNAVKLSEGFDYPPIQSIIIARPTRSPVLYKQMIGRGLRNHPNKDDCIVIEFTGSDPEMMSWEDIDENATYQTLTQKEKISEKEAKKRIQSTYGENVIVKDVRLSSFEFYECLMTRFIRYRKQFIFMPSNTRFLIFKIIPTEQIKGASKFFNVISWHCVWYKEFENFYVWNSGPLFYIREGYTFDQCELIAKDYVNKQHFGKWYPSDLDKITSRQKKLLPLAGNVSSRKAEMMIEDIHYKKLIDTEWLTGKHGTDQSIIDDFFNTPDDDFYDKKLIIRSTLTI